MQQAHGDEQPSLGSPRGDRALDTRQRPGLDADPLASTPPLLNVRAVQENVARKQRHLRPHLPSAHPLVPWNEGQIEGHMRCAELVSQRFFLAGICSEYCPAVVESIPRRIRASIQASECSVSATSQIRPTLWPAAMRSIRSRAISTDALARDHRADKRFRPRTNPRGRRARHG